MIEIALIAPLFAAAIRHDVATDNQPSSSLFVFFRTEKHRKNPHTRTVRETKWRAVELMSELMIYAKHTDARATR